MRKRDGVAVAKKKKRVRFGDVTYVAIPPRPDRLAAYLVNQETDLLGGTNDGSAEQGVPVEAPPLSASSQLLACTPTFEDVSPSPLSPSLLSCGRLAPRTERSPESHGDLGGQSFHDGGTMRTTVSCTQRESQQSIGAVSFLAETRESTENVSSMSREPACLCLTGELFADIASTADVPDAPSAAKSIPVSSAAPEQEEEEQHADGRPAVVRRLEMDTPTREASSSALTCPSASRSPDAAALSTRTSAAPPCPASIQCGFCGLEMEPRAPALDESLPPHWTYADGVVCHTGCALWCATVFYDNAQGRLIHVGEACARAQEVPCEACHRTGAAVGCAQNGCTRQYHLPCAVKVGAELDTKAYTLWCPEHAHPNKT